MPKKEEMEQIRKIAREYHVTLERAEHIYYAHLAAEKKRRKIVRLDQRSLGRKRR